MKHLLTPATALPAAALLAAVGPHQDVLASPVSNVVSDLVVSAETEGIQLTSFPAVDSDFQRDTEFLDDPGEVDISVSSVVALQEVSAQADSEAGMSYETDDDSATFFYALEGFAFGSVATPGNDFGAGGAFSASIETQFTITQSVEYVFSSAFESVVGGAELEIELFDEGSGDPVDLVGTGDGFATGELAEGTYIGLFSLTGEADTGVFSSDFVDGVFEAILELGPGAGNRVGGGTDESTSVIGEIGDEVGSSEEPVEVQPIPTPTAVVAGLIGVGLVVCRRRRA
ncbi:MAG: PTPA-CTERM sorting domain-containing protein [Planctomycetota bacterium]